MESDLTKIIIALFWGTIGGIMGSFFYRFLKNKFDW